jgi:DNA replication protein DnaC
MHTAEQVDDLIARATRSRMSVRTLLEHLVRAELEDRGRRSLERRLKRARLGRFKPMADWEWNWPKTIDRTAVERVLSLDFLARGENVLMVGSQGLGKSMLAKNVAHEAVLSGRSALFTTASDLILDLGAQDSARALEQRFRHYVRPALLVIDEIGYLAYDGRAADLLFQIVSRRYEQRSILVTTNLPFKQWDSVFPNASCAVALIDRLTHHAEIIRIDGKSYRRRQAEERHQEPEGDDQPR